MLLLAEHQTAHFTPFLCPLNTSNLLSRSGGESKVRRSCGLGPAELCDAMLLLFLLSSFLALAARVTLPILVSKTYTSPSLHEHTTSPSESIKTMHVTSCPIPRAFSPTTPLNGADAAHAAALPPQRPRRTSPPRPHSAPSTARAQRGAGAQPVPRRRSVGICCPLLPAGGSAACWRFLASAAAGSWRQLLPASSAAVPSSPAEASPARPTGPARQPAVSPCVSGCLVPGG